eukprot:m.1599240 g.1599240  ORF g.1599240 m.1599240 type:complete len:53 (-) comp25347_c0_seq2:11-169(-)
MWLCDTGAHVRGFRFSYRHQHLRVLFTYATPLRHTCDTVVTPTPTHHTPQYG